MRGAKPLIFLHSEPGHYKGDALVNWNIVHSIGLPVQVCASTEDSLSQLNSLPHPDVIVDALFGTGLTKPIGPDLQGVVRWINGAAAKSLVVSIDIPSGLFADSPAVPGDAVRAHLTVTFTALKRALVFPPASDLAGKIKVVPIGSPEALLQDREYSLDLVDTAIVRSALPARSRDAHKGDFGHLYVVAGSRGKSGAALMTGLAALRSGAGLVTLWLPLELQKDVVGKIPELMTESLPETAEGTLHAEGLAKITGQLSQSNAGVIGPGLTTHDSTKVLVRELVRHSTVPLVVDADGINAFAGSPEAIGNLEGQSIVITPHPGEMARLLNLPIQQVQNHRLEVAQDCARRSGCFVVLKGFQTVIASPTGRTMINCTGNPGMATGGSGDILAGMLGRFVAVWARKRDGKDSEALMRHLAAGVYLHGMAADLAAAEKGMECLIATDLLSHLPEAFRRVAAE
jgi:hydroxyethylthiazole kinase-like uncharacterized protein yjeF